MQWAKKQKGFTIVELLIVIVVIAILAAITIVAYNGIQNRSENAKSVAAVSSFVKALNMYKVDNGDFPSVNSCIGTATTYQGYSGRCWAPESSTWVVNSGLATALAPYVTNVPEPSTKNIETSTSQYRGAIYYPYASGDTRIYVNIVGTTICPDISGLGAAYSGVDRAGGKSCYYRVQQ